MKKLMATAGMCFFLGAGLCAETTLSVSSAVEMALQNNISVKRSKLDVDSLARQAGKSWNVLIPSVSAGLGGSKSNDSSNISAYGTVSASLAISPVLFQNMKQTKLNYESGLITYEAATRTIELSVRKAFYSLIYERENVELLKKDLATAQKQYEQTLANQKVGLVSELDVLTAQVSLENQKPNLSSAELTYQNDLDFFKQLIGVDTSEELVLDGSLDDALLLEKIDISGITVASSDITSLEKQLEIANLKKQTARLNAYMPSLSLSWTYRPSTILNSDVSTSVIDSGSASAAITIPLDSYLPWSADTESVLKADDSIKDIKLQLANARVTSSLEIQALLRRIDQSLATLKARKLNVQLAEKTYAMTEDAYKRGTKDLLSLQDAGDSLQEAKVALMKEAYTLISAVFDLENEIGVPFGTLGRK